MLELLLLAVVVVAMRDDCPPSRDSCAANAQ
jgi:hypothetical protein